MLRSAPEGLTVESIEAPSALWTDAPRFAWRVAADAGPQSGFELEVSGPDGAVTASRSEESRESAWIEIPGFVAHSRTRYEWRVRIRTAGSEPGQWATSWFETSLLDPRDWVASWIEPVQRAVTPEPPLPASVFSSMDRATSDALTGPVEGRLHPAQLLRQVVALADLPKRARLYITAHGVYEARINGTPVSDDVLSPGYDAHPARLSYLGYDVTDLLVSGPNVLAVTLGDGWWAGRLSSSGASANYGDRLGAFWQLEADGEPIAVSDGSVVSATGAIRYSDMFVGEKVDARLHPDGWDLPGFDDRTWTPVRTVAGSAAGLVPLLGEPMRRVREIVDVRTQSIGDGILLADAGENLTGRLRMRARGPAGTTITIEYSETLDSAGRFRPNTSGRNKDMTDVWVLAGSGEEQMEPTFAFRGFRYARITGYPGTPAPGDLTAVVIASDLPETGAFETDDPRLNRLHRNVVASQRSNFASIPTDNANRAREGWTGDVWIFAPAAFNNMRVGLFYRRWLANVRAAQFANGDVPGVVPNTPGFLPGASSLAAWGDAIVHLPLTVYERTGDRRVLEENFDAMARWMAHCRRLARSTIPSRLDVEGLDPVRRERLALLWNTGWNLGDWLVPSTDPRNPARRILTADEEGLRQELFAAISHTHAVTRFAVAAREIGEETAANTAEKDAAAMRAAFVAEYLDDDGLLPVAEQGLLVLTLAYDLVPEDLRGRVARRLVELIDADGGRLDTGIVSSPHLLEVLTGSGHRDVAERVLFAEELPSWLGQVRAGATSVWESWWGTPDTPLPVRLSANQTTFGAVDDWFFRGFAGIRALAAGYRRVRIAPDLGTRLELIRGRLDTPYGRIAVSVRRTADGVTDIEVEVPVGVEAELSLPDREARVLPSGISRTRVVPD